MVEAQKCSAGLGRGGQAGSFTASYNPLGPSPSKAAGPGVGRRVATRQGALGSVKHTQSHTLHIPAVLCQHLGKPGLCGFERVGNK